MSGAGYERRRRVYGCVQASWRNATHPAQWTWTWDIQPWPPLGGHGPMLER